MNEFKIAIDVTFSDVYYFVVKAENEAQAKQRAETMVELPWRELAQHPPYTHKLGISTDVAVAWVEAHNATCIQCGAPSPERNCATCRDIAALHGTFDPGPEPMIDDPIGGNTLLPSAAEHT